MSYVVVGSAVLSIGSSFAKGFGAMGNQADIEQAQEGAFDIYQAQTGLLRSQRGQQKKEAAFRGALKKGDKVVTIGGIHGKITEIGKSAVVLDVHSSGKLKVEKSAISMNAQTEIQQN